jgi:radical SAM protein with 4Fe4S-binding SPASM domain
MIEEHVFNKRYSDKWLRFFVPWPSRRNLKMGMNFLVSKLQLKLRMSKLYNHPYFAVIDPCGICALKCPLCNTGRGDLSRKRGMMSFDEYKKIIDELGDYLVTIFFTDWGEPLMNKELPHMVNYTKNVKKVPFTSLSTNLNPEMSDDYVRELVTSGLDLIIISVDGATQKTYEKYRRGGNLSKVVANTKRILQERAGAGHERPFVVWQFLVFNHNQHEIGEAIKLAEKTGVDSIRICGALVNTSALDRPFKENYEMSKEMLPPIGSRYSEYISMGVKKQSSSICSWLWHNVAIGSGGEVFPCCAVFSEKYSFGNVLTDSFGKIWNNEKYVKARKAVKNRKYAESLKAEENICGPCTVYGNWI